jgi:hypothetical protein
MILYTCKVNKPFKGHTEGEKKMTREENILGELNRAEQRLKKAYEMGYTEDIKAIEGWIEGAHKILQMLGYSAIADDDKDEWVECDAGVTWIYTYKAIEDRR